MARIGQAIDLIIMASPLLVSLRPRNLADATFPRHNLSLTFIKLSRSSGCTRSVSSNRTQMFGAESEELTVRSVKADQVTVTIYGCEGNRHELEKILRLSPKCDLQISPNRFHIRRPGDLLHAEREPRAVLDQIKIELGSHKFSAQYQQCPTPEDGSIIKWGWFESYDEVPNRKYGDQIVQSWDTAMKSGNHNDYSVCLTFLVSGNDYYLLDVFRKRLKYPDLKHQIIRLAEYHRADSYIIEDKGSGTSVIDDIRHSGFAHVSNPIAYVPVADKVTRMMLQSAKIEARHVHLPRHAPWLGDFHDEVLQFPHGRHDDIVDALAQFLDWIDQRRRKELIVRRLPF